MSLNTLAYPHEEAAGRRKLIEAALKLGAEKRGIVSLGLREVAREAGLNPNTFYRHFKDMQELALVAIDEMGDELRRTLIDLRSRMLEPLEASRATVDWSFGFALRHPDAAIALVSEMNSASPTVRGHLRAMMQDLSSDIAANVRRFTSGVAAAPADGDMAFQLSRTVTQQLFQESVNYLENPDQRENIKSVSTTLVNILFSGNTPFGKGRTSLA
ncbi:MAG: TetR family transcriptional regulator [Fluviicoccus sp.]|uniref:TetR family transcriptional regulator n=1 Tax=Fluviicoccus sp. TaxID=2003552 RepID=UPI0027180F01|nr:TetR family transcriptional regulator [Fluviicoccus sp.]MDO8331995.1 TetR family transcriptional regulator [Fluviicoccus sp.]